MVKHIVLWQYNDEIRNGDPDRITALLSEKFAALRGQVPGLHALEFGKNYKNGDYDIALYCELASKEAEAAYQDFPAHVAIKNLLKDWTSERASVDYEV